MGHLAHEAKREFVQDPGAFLFYLSAFFSAARSVTFVLQSEEKAAYDAWFPGWHQALPDGDKELMDFMKNQRNTGQKQGGTKTNAEWEMVPVTQLRYEDGRHANFSYFWAGPPGMESPKVGRLVHYFEFNGSQADVITKCKEHTRLLERLVQDFVAAHSQTQAR